MNKLVLIGMLVSLAVASIASGSTSSSSGGDSNEGQGYLSEGWVTNVLIDNQFACFGSLIGRKTVLTTATCLNDVHYSRVQVEVGARLKQSYRVQAWKVDPYKQSPMDNKITDVAVIALEEASELENGLELVGLPKAEFPNHAILVGPNEQIRIEINECDSDEEVYFVCTNKDLSCINYHGSGLVFSKNGTNVLIGVANKNYPECGRLRFTNMIKHIDWIKSDV